MRAAIVRAYGEPPELGEWPEPKVGPGETLVSVVAVAVSPVVRARAAGRHYSLEASLPLVPGLDGVGRTPDGRRVYFAMLPPPAGTLAERVAVPEDRMVPVPDDLDDASAAAAAIPGISSWLPLTHRARLPPGESVLVNGATGTAGRLAVQTARHLGAAHVAATGRTPAHMAELPALGADPVLSVVDPGAAFQAEVRRVVRELAVGGILDYLWGPSGGAIVAAVGAPDPPRGPRLVRFVQVGAISGEAVSIPGAALRGSGLEILGSGIGSSPASATRTAIAEFLAAFRPGGFRVHVDAQPIDSIRTTWSKSPDEGRLVYRFD
jgi:NADPH:quinone reductase-like Zn-dependent oxidoreductase